MNHTELLNSVRKGDKEVLKKFAAHPRLLARIEAIAANPIPWKRTHIDELYNADGSYNQAGLGFKFAMQSTTLVLADVIHQVYYEEAIAKFASVLVGRGPWLDFIQQPFVGQNGDFHSGDTSMATQSQIPNVEVAMSPITTPLRGWNYGFQWSKMEVERALATNNFDLIKARHGAVEKIWQLGIQEVGFVGNPNDLTNYPGLLSNTQITANADFISGPLSLMTGEELNAFVAGFIALYRNNCANTKWPNRFVVPETDWTGMGVNVSIAGVPIAQTVKEYLLRAFKGICGDKFEMLSTAYANKARNAGWWAPNGTNRYALYNDDPETISMEIPVELQFNAPATGNNYQWNCVADGQYGGMNVYRQPEVMYFDDASSL
jgi:hypothetical protein